MNINQKINNKVVYPASSLYGIHPAILARASMAELIQTEASTKAIQLKQITTVLRADNQKKTGLLKVRTANQCMQDASEQPIPKKLYGELWHEGELCIGYADTNVGKSIAAVQIADRISRGQTDDVFAMEASAQKVIYADFELTDKQFENRYTDNYTNPYCFDDNFLRIGLNEDAIIPDEYKSFDDYLFAELEQLVEATEAKVVIVDNLTYLRAENEQANDAGSLMKQLKKLKEKHGLSMLILAHTPKRNIYKPITVNDLQGSKMIANFSDSIWAIGTSSQENDLRYIKQIKVRATEKRYGEENVIVCQIEKESNFLGFTHVGFGREQAHLLVDLNHEHEERKQQIKDMKAQNMTKTAIAKQLGISEGYVRKILKQQ